MSLRTGVRGPKGAPFAGRGATRERCPAPASGRSRANEADRGAGKRTCYADTYCLPHVIASQWPGVRKPGKFMDVIASQCMGAPQRGTLCGERSPKGALLPRWPLAGGEHGGLWGDEVWQSVPLAAAQNEKHHFRRIRKAPRIRPNGSAPAGISAEMRIAASLRSSQ